MNNEIENNPVEIKKNILINNVVNFILSPDKNNNNYRIDTINKMFENYTFTKRYIIFIIINDIFSKNKMSENDFNIIRKIIDSCSAYTNYIDELYNSTVDHILYKIFLKKNIDQNRMNILQYILDAYSESNLYSSNDFSNKIIGHKFNGKDLTINAIKSHNIQFNSGKISASEVEKREANSERKEKEEQERINREKKIKELEEALELVRKQVHNLNTTSSISFTGNSPESDELRNATAFNKSSSSQTFNGNVASLAQKSANALQNEPNFNNLSRGINLERGLGNNQINQLTAQPITPGVSNFNNQNISNQAQNNSSVSTPSVNPQNISKQTETSSHLNGPNSENMGLVNLFNESKKGKSSNSKNTNIITPSVSPFNNQNISKQAQNNSSVTTLSVNPFNNQIISKQSQNNSSVSTPSVNPFNNQNISKQSQNNSSVSTPSVNPFNNIQNSNAQSAVSPSVRPTTFNNIQNNGIKSKTPSSQTFNAFNGIENTNNTATNHFKGFPIKNGKNPRIISKINKNPIPSESSNNSFVVSPMHKNYRSNFSKNTKQPIQQKSRTPPKKPPKPFRPTSSTPNNGSKSNNATLILQSENPIIPNTGVASNATKLSTSSNTQIINPNLRGNNTLQSAINSQKKATKLQEQATQLQEQATAEQKKTAGLFNRLEQNKKN